MPRWWRMAAGNFPCGVPLIDGQGTFGSVDGDPPAAMPLHPGAARQDPPMP